MELPVSEETKQHLLEKGTWSRGLFMLLFIVINSFVRLGIELIALVQFVIVLFSTTPNSKLVELGQSLSTFSYQIMLFVTYNTEARPYPFDEVWPVAEPLPETQASKKAAKSHK